jgi:predicted protein tyrosine phosphatase
MQRTSAAAECQPVGRSSNQRSFWYTAVLQSRNNAVTKNARTIDSLMTVNTVPGQFHAKACMKLLFICSQNRRRSLTAERIFDGIDGHLVRSAGTEEGARIRVTPGHLGWADIIFVMEKRHHDRLRTKFRHVLAGKQVICLHIADRYNYMDDALIERLETTVGGYLRDNQHTREEGK